MGYENLLWVKNLFMNKLKLILFISTCMALCCNNNKPEETSAGGEINKNEKSVFAGNWISKNYQDSLDIYGMPSKLKFSATEICISYAADSMCEFIMGIGRNIFSIVEKSDTSFRVRNYDDNSFADFYLTAGGREIYYESKTDHQQFYFFRAEPKYAVKEIDGWNSAFELYFNERMIADNYFLLNPENKPSMRVAFTSYGEITGLPGYKSFKICYGETCVHQTKDDLITLSDSGNSENFIWNWKNDTLIFYSVLNTSAEKNNPYYEKGTEIFKFIKSLNR